jgi:hypothetical protein
MKTFSEFINESAIDLPKNSLDPTVFDFFDDRLPVLKAGIKYQIAKDVDVIEEILHIKRFYIVGSILSRKYSKNADIDVTVEVDERNIDEMLEAKAFKLVEKMNGKLAVGTTHPINYYIFVKEDEEIEEGRFEGIYDVINDKWIKQPKDLQFNINNYLNKFENTVSRADLMTAKLRRDIIDFKELTTFSKDEIKDLHELLQIKLYKINTDIEALIDFKKTIKRKRDEAFNRPLDPDEIEKFQTRNHLPDNVVYKMLEKYYYWDFIQRLEAIIGEDAKLTAKDVRKVSHAEKEFMEESFKTPKQTDEFYQANLVVFGAYMADTHEVILKLGLKQHSHMSLHFPIYNQNCIMFRYLPSTQTIYWWFKRMSPKAGLVAAKEALEKKGYKVRKQVDMDVGSGYEDTHNRVEVKGDSEDRTLMPESFKHFMFLEDAKPVKAKEKMKVDMPETPTWKIRSRADGKVVPEYKKVDPARADLNNFLKPYLALDSFKPVKLGLVKLVGGKTVNAVEMLINGFPPTKPLTDQEPYKWLGNTQIMVYKDVDGNYWMKKG